MNKLILIIIVTFAFISGYALNSFINKRNNLKNVARATGIGGIFFKCKNPVELKNWYKKNLKFNVDEYGTVFEWRQGADTTQKGYTQWSPFNEKTKYFEPSSKDFMINYRVEKLDELVVEFKKNGVQILDSIESYEYGRFLHILDLEGNKIELWEPNDIEFEKLGKKLNSQTTK